MINLFSFYILVFEYDGLSGDGPFNLLIEENLLQHRVPFPRTRSGQKSFRTLYKSKLQGQETRVEETNLLSRTQNDFIGAAGSEAADVSADVQSDTSEMFDPTRLTDSNPPNTQGVTVETLKPPFHFLPHPVGTSSHTETRETTRGTTQPPENTQDSQAAVIVTTSPRSQHPMENRPKSSIVEPTNPIPNQTNDSSATTSVSPDTVHVAPMTIAPMLIPKASATAFSTPAATIAPLEELESFQVSTVPPSMQRSTTSLPDTTVATTAPTTTTAISTTTTTTSTTTTTTEQAEQIKRTHRMSWVEEREALDEPMPRQEDSAKRKPSELTSACVKGKGSLAAQSADKLVH